MSTNPVTRPQQIVERLAALRTDAGLPADTLASTFKVLPDDPTTAAGAIEFIMQVLDVLEWSVKALAFDVHALKDVPPLTDGGS